ncbi:MULTISPECIES: hypothetical protein [unclassified Rhizobium]|uniref:hypothetical protein n=1 Tax=unclassified Rhizobium TaxID=2613769 RepID=UPI0007EBEB1D|nr:MULTISPECIES: hypothetical protein [unclassified Rhizobium]ANK85452.1 hypothetical protein AMK02_CH01851 [Rhizobium sp. N731]ANL15699.1 hypothetical protein AMJ97_CH01850 [Rhizobium sp. N1314]
MKMLFASLAAIVLSASFALPLNAAPIVVSKAVATHTADVEQVKHRRHGNRHAYGHWKKHRYAYRDCRYYGSCYRPRYYGSRDYYGYRDYYPYRHQSGVTVYFDF